MTSRRLSHLGRRGEARMVDVSHKLPTERTAIAEGPCDYEQVHAQTRPRRRRQEGRRAGRGPHRRHHGGQENPRIDSVVSPLPVSKVEVDIAPDKKLPGLTVRSTVKVTGNTGVEMEALTAVSVACLTIYDMVKAVERGMRIEGVRLIEKRGGKSGTFKADA